MLHASCFSSKSGNADIRHVTIRCEEPVKTRTELRKSSELENQSENQKINRN